MNRRMLDGDISRIFSVEPQTPFKVSGDAARPYVNWLGLRQRKGFVYDPFGKKLGDIEIHGFPFLGRKSLVYYPEHSGGRNGPAISMNTNFRTASSVRVEIEDQGLLDNLLNRGREVSEENQDKKEKSKKW